MTLARELIEAMGNGVESEAVHRLNRNRFLRALRTLRERGPSDGMIEEGVHAPDRGDVWGVLVTKAFNAMLVELIREIEEER